MKAAIALCVWITLCGVTTVLAENKSPKKKCNAQCAVEETKKKVNSIMVGNIEALMQTQMALTLQRVSVSEMVQIKLKNELNKVRAAVDAKAAKGNDAEYCFNDAAKEYDAIKGPTEAKLVQCVNDSLEEFVDRFRITMVFQNAAKEALSIIDAVYDDCASRLYQRKRCFANWSKNTRAYIEHFTPQYRGYLVYRKLRREQAFDETLECLQTVIEDAMQKITKINKINMSCVEGA